MTPRFAPVFLALALVLPAQTAKEWQSTFPVDKKNLGIKGDNPYFPLTPGYKLFYRHEKNTETITVLAETKVIDGVECRVVEDREDKSGRLFERTLDYFAIDSASNDVYYMGEDVTVFKNGKESGHEGAWLSGVKGARFGMMLPANPKVGQRFYQEWAPGVGMDRIEVKSVGEKIVTPAGTFENAVLVEETSALEKGLKDLKWYVRGVGTVRDEEMLLVSYGTK